MLRMVAILKQKVHCKRGEKNENISATTKRFDG